MMLPFVVGSPGAALSTHLSTTLSAHYLLQMIDTDATLLLDYSNLTTVLWI
jgi:hypothetical protein